MQAFSKKTGERVAIGDSVTDFRGNPATLAKLVRPAEPGRDGKVIVEGSPVAYYAGVFDLDVRDDDDDRGCEGHESLAGAHMGESILCDGSCRRYDRR